MDNGRDVDNDRDVHNGRVVDNGRAVNNGRLRFGLKRQVGRTFDNQGNAVQLAIQCGWQCSAIGNEVRKYST